MKQFCFSSHLAQTDNIVNLGTKKFVPILLMLFHQLIWHKGIFETAASLILYFYLQQMLFQQTYSLFWGWLLIAQTQYRTINKCCEEIPRQGTLREKCTFSEFSGPCFPAFGLNTERYGVFSPNEGKYGPEYGQKIGSEYGHFSRSGKDLRNFQKLRKVLTIYKIKKLVLSEK